MAKPEQHEARKEDATVLNNKAKMGGMRKSNQENGLSDTIPAKEQLEKPASSRNRRASKKNRNQSYPKRVANKDGQNQIRSSGESKSDLSELKVDNKANHSKGRLTPQSNEPEQVILDDDMWPINVPGLIKPPILFDNFRKKMKMEERLRIAALLSLQTCDRVTFPWSANPSGQQAAYAQHQQIPFHHSASSAPYYPHPMPFNGPRYIDPRPVLSTVPAFQYGQSVARIAYTYPLYSQFTIHPGGALYPGPITLATPQYIPAAQPGVILQPGAIRYPVEGYVYNNLNMMNNMPDMVRPHLVSHGPPNREANAQNDAQKVPQKAKEADVSSLSSTLTPSPTLQGELKSSNISVSSKSESSVRTSEKNQIKSYKNAVESKPKQIVSGRRSVEARDQVQVERQLPQQQQHAKFQQYSVPERAQSQEKSMPIQQQQNDSNNRRKRSSRYRRVKSSNSSEIESNSERVAKCITPDEQKVNTTIGDNNIERAEHLAQADGGKNFVEEKIASSAAVDEQERDEPAREKANERSKEASKTDDSKPTSPSNSGMNKSTSWAALFKSTEQTKSSIGRPGTGTVVPSSVPENIRPVFQHVKENSLRAGAPLPGDAIHFGNIIESFDVSSKTQRLMRPRGMMNNGNTCYLNAVLQVLAYCPPLNNLFTMLEREKLSSKRVSLRFPPATCAMINLTSQLAMSQRNNKDYIQGKHGRIVLTKVDGSPAEEALNPRFIYEMMDKAKAGHMKMHEHQQQDCHEFFNALIMLLHEEMACAMKSAKEARSRKANAASGVSQGAKVGGENISSSEESAAAAVSTTWNTVGRKGKMSGFLREAKVDDTPIYKVFGGLIRSVRNSAGDRNFTDSEPFFYLQLQMGGKEINSVRSALAAYFKAERLHGYKRNSNGEETEATRQYQFEEIPPVLTLQIKCFDYTAEGGKKLVRPFQVDSDIQLDSAWFADDYKKSSGGGGGGSRNNKNRNYKLYGIVYHIGERITGGHYTSLTFYPHIDGCWMSCNDDKIEAGEFGKHLKNLPDTAMPYLVFYRRQDTIARGRTDPEQKEGRKNQRY